MNMNAAEIIQEIQRLPETEQGKVVEVRASFAKSRDA